MLFSTQKNDFLNSLPREAPENALSDLAPATSSREEEKNIRTFSTEELVDFVLHTLTQTGVQPIEWRSILRKRMGIPVIFKYYYYLIRDADIDRAVSAVLEMGIPFVLPPPLLVDTCGDFHAKGRHFRLDRYHTVAMLEMLVLCPLSLPSFDESELDIQERYTMLDSPLCKTILVPRPPAVFASIIRMMANYSRWSPTRSLLASDLSELIVYYLYDMHDGFPEIDDDEACEELGVDQRLEDGAATVRTWLHEGDWRECEEWMLDALYWVVAGLGDVEHIPWAPP